METLLPGGGEEQRNFLPELFVYLLVGEGSDRMPMKTETGQLERAKHPFIPLMISYHVQHGSKEPAWACAAQFQRTSWMSPDKWKTEIEARGCSLPQSQGSELRTETINKKHKLWVNAQGSVW